MRIQQDPLGKKSKVMSLIRRFHGNENSFYHPIFNRVSIATEEQHLLNALSAAAHEFEHAYHRNTAPAAFLVSVVSNVSDLLLFFSPPIGPLVTHRIESRAIAAQWEFARRIPASLRAGYAMELRERRLGTKELGQARALYDANLAEQAVHWFQESAAAARTQREKWGPYRPFFPEILSPPQSPPDRIKNVLEAKSRTVQATLDPAPGDLARLEAAYLEYLEWTSGKRSF